MLLEIFIFLTLAAFLLGMGHMGELGRSRSMGAKLVEMKRQDGSSYTTHYLGKNFIGNTFVTLEIKNKDGETVQEEVEVYVYNTAVIATKFLTTAPVNFELPDQHYYKVIDMAMGKTHMIVIARTRTQETKVFATGHNQYGQLGLGHTENRHWLTEITAFQGKDPIHQVAVGAFHTLFLNATGTALYSCGRSDSGQLGLYRTVQEPGAFVMVPTKVNFPETTKGQRIAKITSGANTSLVIMDNGDCYTWGFNPGQASDILEPTKLRQRAYKNRDPEKRTTAAAVVDASCGAQHSLFLVQQYSEE